MSAPNLDPTLNRILHGPDADGADDAVARACAVAATRVLQVPLPPPGLTGWSSLCAGEYAEAVQHLHRLIGLAWSACAAAARPT